MLEDAKALIFAFMLFRGSFESSNEEDEEERGKLRDEKQTQEQQTEI